MYVIFDTSTHSSSYIIREYTEYLLQVPKRKPLPIDQPSKDAKPLPAPKKYSAFSAQDSRSIESAFQKLAEHEDAAARRDPTEGDLGNASLRRSGVASNIGSKQNTSFNDSMNIEKGGLVKVPVNEDYLFDVDIEERELAPTYWLGPIYDVRRGSWFYQDGSMLRPCDENLAIQLEEGYLKVKPWRYRSTTTQPSAIQPRTRPISMAPGSGISNPDSVADSKLSKPNSADDLRGRSKEETDNSASVPAKFELQTQRLFGSYMNSVVTYQDATVAWLLTDDFLSRMSSTVYQRFAGGGHLGGTKVVRGYSEATKSKDGKPEADESIQSGGLGSATSPTDPKKASIALRKDSEHTDVRQTEDSEARQRKEASAEPESKLASLERQMSNLVSSSEPEDPVKQEEEARKRAQDEIQQDYRGADGDDQAREIEHLVLVTHGIGQRLGLRMESVNFIHDVNILRKTLKSVYETSPDLQALNAEVDKLPKNCRVQVLPVVWRHLLDFPKQSFKQNRREQDLTDADAFGDEEEYPSLNDITVEGVPAIRNLITDLALDILLYQSAYREHIAGIVQRECNRIYELFMQRNPHFKGKVSLIGHSLGSAILFDILSRQKEAVRPTTHGRHRSRSQRHATIPTKDQTQDLGLSFDVESFFCLGSPLGLYQMLKGRRIAGRRSLHTPPTESPFYSDSMDDPFLGAPQTQSEAAAADKDTEILSITVSSPKCQQLFNIFHPADPIAYRIEPLITPAMASLKPQALPYTKKGIFGPGQGLTGIGARVGQSVSGFWSNITSGVASSLLNRSLGLTGEGQISSSQPLAPPQVQPVRTAGAGTNITAGGVIAGSTNASAGTSSSDGKPDQHPPTLIDAEIETLYAGFQKHRKSLRSDGDRDLGESPEWKESSERARRLRREEAKVRALNSNGRVDFSIQEGVFDISLIASIASHLSYWADEDVSHFMLGQLLSRGRVLKRPSN